MPDDALLLDIREDLDRIDRVMTQVVSDPVTADEFIRDPSGVLSRLGLHARTTRDIHDRSNRIFYAVLTNTELIDVVSTHFESFVAPDSDGDRVQRDALGRGELEHPASLDEAALDHCLRDPEMVRTIFGLLLTDLNRRRLLQNYYTAEQLDAYRDELSSAIGERRGIREMPVLEAWDSQYGVGNRQGVGMVEVGGIATLALIVEVALPTTVFIPVSGDVVMKAQAETLADAIRGDPVGIRTLATAGALMGIAGEMLLHANNFERA